MLLLFGDAAPPLELGNLAMYVLGGLAIFLFGLDQMADALKLLAGDGMKKLLARLTTNRFAGLLAGAVVTALIQSSSVTTVLIVGFISGGLMSLSQSIGVILGANIGTTITAQLIAFKITHYSLILVAAGFALLFCFRPEKVRQSGQLIMGLGLIFFGMQLMSEGTDPLRFHGPFLALMQQMHQPLLAILVAAAFTAIVQSSSATMGVVIVLAGQGLITLQTGIALALGANIGTCVTALLAAIGKPREAVRAAVLHVFFKVVGVAIWYGLIDQLAWLVTWLSPAYEHLQGAERLAAETPRQIANAHTVFNVANALLFIWFTTPLAWLMRRVIPEPKEGAEERPWPRYLDELLFQTPSLALDVVRMELGRLGAAALRMVRGALDTVIHGNEAELHQLEAMDNDVDRLHGAIVTYLGRLSQENLSDRQSRRLRDYLAAANYIENVGDMIQTNLFEAGMDRLQAQLQVSPATEQVLDALNQRVIWAVEQAIRALVGADPEAAAEVLAAKDQINRLAADAEEHLSRRLAADEPNRLATFRLESEIMEYLRRMYYFAKRIAKIVVEANATYISRETEPSAADGQ